MPIHPKRDRSIADMPEALFQVLAPLGHVCTVDHAVAFGIPVVASGLLDSCIKMRLSTSCESGFYRVGRVL